MTKEIIERYTITWLNAAWLAFWAVVLGVAVLAGGPWAFGAAAAMGMFQVGVLAIIEGRKVYGGDD